MRQIDAAKNQRESQDYFTTIAMFNFLQTHSFIFSQLDQGEVRGKKPAKF